MKEGKIIIPFNELEEYRKNQELEENSLSRFINKGKGEGNFKGSSREVSEQQSFKELIYTIYQPKNMVIFKGVLSNDALIQQVFLSSEYLNTALGSNDDALEVKILEANKPEDYGLYYLERGSTPEIIGTNLILTKDSLFTLLCLVDCKRRKRALSFLMHQVEEKEIGIKELQDISEENMAFKDPRWLGGFFIEKSKGKLEYSIEKGLKELEQVQFLKVKKEVVEITEAAEMLLSILERKQVILSYENYYLESKDKISGEQLLFIKSDNALFLIQDIEGGYSFTSIHMGIAKEVLETIFQVVEIIEEPNAPIENHKDKDIPLENEKSKQLEKTKGNVCPACGVKVHGNSKFCKNCGTEMKKQPGKEQKAKFCNQCGNEVSDLGKFCKKCGATITKSEE